MLTNFPENNGLDLAKIADEVQKKWEKENTFEISISSRPKENPFVFFEGKIQFLNYPIYFQL